MNKENKTIIKALNMCGRVPEQWELLEEIERLNKALQDIKDFIDKHTKVKKETNTKYLLTNVKDDNILIDIVNKALGSDKE